MPDVVVVESPAKAKTINKYLGRDFTVLASFGHVRDLPPKDGSVRPEEDFAMDWESEDRGERQVNEIARALRGARRLFLATDPDREGEAISWHVREMLARKGALKGVEVNRITFNEITKRAVQHAIAHPRDARHAADRRLPGAPGARLPGRLHPFARAVAQAAGQPQRRARAIGRAAADLRARGGDRGVPRPRVLDRRGPLHHAAGRALHRPADPSRRPQARTIRPAGRGLGDCAPRRPWRRASSASSRSRSGASGATRRALHHLDLAAGGLAQARPRRAADHARRAAAL